MRPPTGRPAELQPGSRVAGYQLEDLIGVGGMAAVFRARDQQLGRTVALKLLAGDKDLRRRFAGEALAAAAVDHPHIIPVYAAGEADGYQYIAMRFVAGHDLRAVIRVEGGLPARRAAAIISPVASALDSAHEAGLVHRDVKPGNILVDARPGRPEHVYLSDFGLARRAQSASGLTVPGQFIGTPHYAAPEQASGGLADSRADQYALACIAYELLSGAVPFRRDQPMLVLWAHVSAPPPRLSAVRPDLPGAVDGVLARAMEKVPDRRYDSCGTFADALRDALGVEPYDPRRLVRPAPAAPVVPEATATRILTITTVPVSPELGSPEPISPVSPEPISPVSPGPISPVSPGPISPVSPGPISPVSGAVWTAVVTADRAYYDNMRPVAAGATTISFPAYVAERRFRLSGTEVRIGRRSRSMGIEPEIDLSGPPTDTGVSRLHAVLIRAADGTWSVIDLDSPNGIQVNGADVPASTAVPLRAGDRIHLGAWTLITITRG